MLTATPAPKAKKLDPPIGWSERLRARASQPVPAASTAAARIFFGLCVAYSATRFLAKGWVHTLYLEPSTHLTYRHFEWIRPLPSLAMHLVVVLLAACGIAIALGYRHRAATLTFLVGFIYTELIEATLYLNHYWFLTSMGALMLLLPVHHHWSLDARSGRVPGSNTVPAATVWILRTQVGVVYVFAGIAKLNADWLLHAQPLQLWLTDRSDLPLVGHLLGLRSTAYIASWTAALFDLTIIAWLLWRRTRLAAWILLIGFHIGTGLLFPIGVFPIVMITATLIFFAPDWPTRFARKPPHTLKPETSTTPRVHKTRRIILIAFLTMQVLLPLRHYTIDGNVRWTEQGYYLSWRVMLTDKAGFTQYQVTDTTTGQTWHVNPNLVLTDWQSNQATTNPDLIHATALLISDHYRRIEPDLKLEIRAEAWISLNGEPAQRALDPTIDLLTQPRGQPPLATPK